MTQPLAITTNTTVEPLEQSKHFIVVGNNCKHGHQMQGELTNNIVAKAISICQNGIDDEKDKNNVNVYTISNGRFSILKDGKSDNINGKITSGKKKSQYKDSKDNEDDKDMNVVCRVFCGQTQSGPSNIHLLIAEFVGTGLLLFMGCMGCITNYEIMVVPHYMSALCFGLTVMLIIQMFGHISGAHLNPAVTMVTALLGMIDIMSVPFYLLGQFAGAIAGLFLLKALVPASYSRQDFFDELTNQTIHKQGLCTTNLHPEITSIQGLVIEIVITFILIFVCCAIWDKRNATKQDSVPLRFGFVISAIAIAAGPFSGGSMNTARSFAPALLNNDWENQWVYWIGPTIGALIAHFFYKYLYALPDDEENADEYEEVSMKAMNKNDVKV